MANLNCQTLNLKETYQRNRRMPVSRTETLTFTAVIPSPVTPIRFANNEGEEESIKHQHYMSPERMEAVLNL